MTYVEAEVARDGGTALPVRLLVDSGRGVFRAAGVRVAGARSRGDARDGVRPRRRHDRRPQGVACMFVYAGVRAPSPVILGEPGDAALLGTVTLESLGLVLNPFDRTLHPMRARLAMHG